MIEVNLASRTWKKWEKIFIFQLLCENFFDADLVKFYILCLKVRGNYCVYIYSTRKWTQSAWTCKCQGISKYILLFPLLFWIEEETDLTESICILMICSALPLTVKEMKSLQSLVYFGDVLFSCMSVFSLFPTNTAKSLIAAASGKLNFLLEQCR